MLMQDLMRPLLDFDRLFQHAVAASESSLPVDVRREKDRYVVEVEVPGAGKEDVGIEVEGDVLVVKRAPAPKVPEGARAVLRGRVRGEASRRLRFQEKIDTERVEARLKNGILRLEIPLAAEARPRKIAIR